MKHLVAVFCIVCFLITSVSLAQGPETPTPDSTQPVVEATPIESREVSMMEMEERLKIAERKTLEMEKEQKKAERKARKQEKYLLALAETEKTISRKKVKYRKLESKLEKGRAKGKLSAEEISKISGKLEEIQKKITREEAKLRKLARRS